MGHAPSLTLATVFGQHEGAEKERRGSFDDPVYHFGLHGLLEGQILTIDGNHGTVQVSPGEDIVPLTEMELLLVMAIAQSYPCTVASYQMLALSTSQGIVEARRELADALEEGKAYERLMHPVRELLAACNHKLKPLGIHVREQEREFLLDKVHNEHDHAIPAH